MTKAYTEDDLSRLLQSDLLWRLREISDLKTSAKDADATARPVLLRALVTIAYSHWEGYVKYAAKKMLEHISLRKLRFKELSPHLRQAYFVPRVSAASGTPVSARMRLISEIVDSGELRFSRLNEKLIDTRSNLNFETFSDICSICGIDVSGFEGEASFIDLVILKRQNSIAHGEDTLIDVSELDELSEKTIGLMRLFGNEVENQVALGKYRAA